MALFGSSRDISVFRYINRELMGDIINQQAAYYKFVLEKTKTNIYGEAAGNKYFNPPVLFNCLIERNDQAYPNVFPEIGDIIMYQEGYFEVDTIINNQLFVGKDPDYPNEANPLNPGLANFGWDVSIICKTHYTPADKVNIDRTRL